MSKHYYRLLIDSATGKRLTEFWQRCIRCEREAERYCKKMGGQYYYEDPKYFAGGVSFISFPGNKPSDPQMWREVGTQHADDSFNSVREPDYKGATAAGDVVYFEPNVRKTVDWVELPSQDFRPQDTFDCIHSTMPAVERDGKWFVQCCRFIYDEPPGRSGSQPDGLRVASRTVRRAIKAEIQREKLPVMRVEPLLSLLGADLQPQADGGKAAAAAADVSASPAADGSAPDSGASGGVNGRATTVNTTKPSATTISSTPTFFAYAEHYYIGCDYPCTADGLRDLTPQQYKTASDLYLRQINRKSD